MAHPSYFHLRPADATMNDTSANTAADTQHIKSNSLLAIALSYAEHSPVLFTTLAITITFFAWAYKQSIPELDAKEPPLMLPRIPFLGHIISVARDQAQYFKYIHKRTGAKIATLPVLNRKMYAIWDPELMQSALRQRGLAFEPCAVDFAEIMLDMSEETYKLIRNTDLVDEFFGVLRTTFRGEDLLKMNSAALHCIAGRLDSLDQQVVVPNLFDFVRQLMTMATCNALLGEHSPMISRPELVDHLWTWEYVAHRMLLVPFHSTTYPEAVNSRGILQSALGEYYTAKHDTHESAAAVTTGRAAVLRKYGVTDMEIGRFEASLLQLATANTIPTAFWVISYIISDPELLSEIRKELQPLVRVENNVATIRTSDFEKAAPLFVSCYYETVRVVNHALCARRIVEDTTISNGRGESYLLKKGYDVQMSGGFVHNIPDIWGSDAAEFRPDRFMKQAPEDKKKRRTAYIPFGGGRHLCPGRHFAFTEIQGCAAMMVLGFDISADGGGKPVPLPEKAPSTIMGAAVRPARYGDGTRVVMRRREGWEGVRFAFDVGTTQPTPF